MTIDAPPAGRANHSAFGERVVLKAHVRRVDPPAKNRGRPLGYRGTVRRFNFFRMAIKIPYVILCLARASSYAAPCLRLARFLGAVPVIAT